MAEQTKVQKSLQEAHKHKADGNQFFSSQDWTKALQQYHLANLILRGLVGSGNDKDMTLGMANKAVGNEMSDAEKKEAIELQTTVRLNLAACLLKVEKPQRAVEELDLVIKQDQTLVKAYYRRGQALFTLKEFDKAKADFLKAQQLNPDDKTIPNYLKKIAVWEREQDKKMASTYSKMFQ